MDKYQEIHMGRGIRYSREQKKWTQEELAIALGAPWDQKKVSNLEKKQTVEESTLHIVAEALEVDPAVLRNYAPDGSFKMNTHTRTSTPQSALYAPPNPATDRFYMSVLKDIAQIFQRQTEEMKTLYERLLDCERRNRNSA